MVGQGFRRLCLAWQQMTFFLSPAAIVMENDWRLVCGLRYSNQGIYQSSIILLLNIHQSYGDQDYNGATLKSSSLAQNTLFYEMV